MKLSTVILGIFATATLSSEVFAQGAGCLAPSNPPGNPHISFDTPDGNTSLLLKNGRLDARQTRDSSQGGDISTTLVSDPLDPITLLSIAYLKIYVTFDSTSKTFNSEIRLSKEWIAFLEQNNATTSAGLISEDTVPGTYRLDYMYHSSANCIIGFTPNTQTLGRDFAQSLTAGGLVYQFKEQLIFDIDSSSIAAIGAAQNEFGQLTLQIQGLQSQINGLMNTITGLNNTITGKDQTITSLNTQITTLLGQLSDKDIVIAQRDATIAALQNELNSRANQINTLNSLVTDRDQKILDLQAKLAITQSTVDNLRSASDSQKGKLLNFSTKALKQQTRVKSFAQKANKAIGKLAGKVRKAIKSMISIIKG